METKALLTVKIETGNAAFDDGEGPYELERILREAGAAIRLNTVDARSPASGRLRDINGNTVGSWEIAREEEGGARPIPPEDSGTAPGSIADPAGEAIGRIARFVKEWPTFRMRDDVIQGLHMGVEGREAELRCSDLVKVLAALEMRKERPSASGGVLVVGHEDVRLPDIFDRSDPANYAVGIGGALGGRRFAHVFLTLDAALELIDHPHEARTRWMKEFLPLKLFRSPKRPTSPEGDQ